MRLDTRLQLRRPKPAQRRILPEHQNTAAKLAAHLNQVLGRKPVIAGNPDKPCATSLGAQAAHKTIFRLPSMPVPMSTPTGEHLRSAHHLAQETDTVFVSAGHHATERYGIQALGSFLAATFGIEHHPSTKPIRLTPPFRQPENSRF